MEINIKHEISLSPELLKFFKSLTPQSGESTPVAQPVKKSRKAAIEEEPAEEPEEEPAEEPEEEADELTLEKVREKATAVAEGGQRTEVKALLKKYKAETTKTLDPKYYEAFYKKLEELEAKNV